MIPEYPNKDKSQEVQRFANYINLFETPGFDSNKRKSIKPDNKDFEFRDAEEFLQELLKMRNQSDAKRLQFYIKMNTVIEEERERKVRMLKAKNRKPIVAHWKQQNE